MEKTNKMALNFIFQFSGFDPWGAWGSFFYTTSDTNKYAGAWGAVLDGVYVRQPETGCRQDIGKGQAPLFYIFEDGNWVLIFFV